MKKSVVGILLIVLSTTVQALNWQADARVAALFEKYQLDGTFVLYDVQREQYSGFNLARAETRFIPASTFKIVNSLIGLTVGAVKDVHHKLPYGGQPQYLKVWEQDMGLADAIAVSNVPVYQALARRIGKQRMRHALEAIPYGNAQVGSEIDQFWLQGPVAISAIEQAHYLAKLAQLKLPFPVKVQQDVAAIIQQPTAPGRLLYAKTGWASSPEPDIGWWVGWVQKNHEIYSFALNINIQQSSDGAQRKHLGNAILSALDLVEFEPAPTD
ncbi:class D beta-lactamase [Echinimonas agarilytica]|uniref:Beta-lactamase n=1 Tax=Echinimonas agarilytica TaxID=1215918 RepID=A0AA42B8T4_9GAMM|nr:class D beta-lactamase [Echinimonas agarilytica]MCM2681247.1 class D beta-lactamase [Echinimonas agarilytica]